MKLSLHFSRQLTELMTRATFVIQKCDSSACRETHRVRHQTLKPVTGECHRCQTQKGSICKCNASSSSGTVALERYVPQRVKRCFQSFYQHCSAVSCTIVVSKQRMSDVHLTIGRSTCWCRNETLKAAGSLRVYPLSMSLK